MHDLLVIVARFEQQEILSVLRFPKEIGRVNDVDWVASDKLALSIADGYITITDASLKTFMSPLIDLPLAGELPMLQFLYEALLSYPVH